MPALNDEQSRSVLVIHTIQARADALGAMLQRAGACWTFSPVIGSETSACAPDARYDAVLIHQTAVERYLDSGAKDLRQVYAPETVLVGIVHSTALDAPTLFGAGLDVVIYEPLMMADLERALAFIDALRNESPEQSRERLRMMTALHELAITAGRKTGSSGWMNRLLAAGRRILGPDALAMWTIDWENRRMQCTGSSNLPAEYIREAEQRSPALIDDYASVPEELSTHWLAPEGVQGTFRVIAPDAAQEAGIQRIAWLPVRDVNRLYGHLSFYFTSERSYQSYDLVLADAFAQIVAAALGTHSLQSEIRRSNRIYREHVEMSLDGVIVCLPDGTIERANNAVSTISGRDRYEILGESVFNLFRDPESVPWEEWSRLELDESIDPKELWLVRSNGARRRVSCYARRLQLPHPVVVDETEDRIQLVVEDVTVQARRLVELELFHDLTRLISERGSIDDAYELVVSRLYNYLNYHLVSIGEVVDGFLLVSRAYRSHDSALRMPSYFDATMGVCGRAVRENRSILVRDVAEADDYYNLDDHVRSELVSVIRVDGKPVGVIDIQTDEAQPLDEEDLQLTDSIAAHLGLLIEQVTVHERLERQAMTDPLTGMANRRAFMQELNSLIRDPVASPAGLFLVELDHFKQINDRYGHLFGDEMLKQVGIRLQSVLRSNDVLARYGGDEIAIIFRDLKPERAIEIAERLRHAISDEPFFYDGQSAWLSVSIGIALYPFHGRTTDTLIGEADRAMYAAKLEGRNSVHGDFLFTEPSD